MKLNLLRQKILDLAIRGKLVPQDPNDEPASVLLERIRAEKDRLIAEGKIKRPKKSKATSSESHYQKFTPPFAIPESWEWVEVAELGEIVTGNTPPKDIQEYYGGEIPFFKPNDLEQGIETVNSLDHLSDLGYRQSRQLPINTILITCIGATIGKAGLIRREGACNQQINAIIPFAQIAPEYIYFSCISGYFQSAIRKNASATTLPILNKNNFSGLLLPLPPANEQRRIIKQIYRLIGELIDIETSEEKLATFINITKSKILDLAMQGKLVPQDPSDEPATSMLRRINPKAKIITDNPHYWNIPKSWCWCQLGDIFKHNTGKALNSSNKDGIAYEYITTSNVYWGKFELHSLKKMLFKDNEIDKCLVKKGDLLICEGGDVGRAAVWDLDTTIMIQNHLHRLRPYSERISAKLYCIFMKAFKDKQLIGGKGIALQGFSSNALHKLIMPLPPASEQKRILAKIEELLGFSTQ